MTLPKLDGRRYASYDPAFCETVLDLGAKGKGPAQISAALGVPRSTMQSWGDAHPEFKEALADAKTLEQAWWENYAQENLAADKFQQQVWSKSVSARFREDYTERRDVTTTGNIIIQASKADEQL